MPTTITSAAVNGGIASIDADGKSLGFIPTPDPLTTNLCFDRDEREMFVTLSGTGRLVKFSR